MSRDDKQDIALIALALLAAAGAYLIHHLKPLPLHRRIWVQAKATVGR